MSQDLHEQLSALIDGELEAERARFLLKRLGHDADLAARWERWQLASAALGRHGAQPMPAGFATRVGALLAAERTPALRWRHWHVGAGLAASIALAAWLLPRPTGDSDLAIPAPAVAVAVADSGAASPFAARTPAVSPVSGASRGLAELAPAARKPWPRSPLQPASDPALESYLVRHTAMSGDDSLGGFVPYVDVVTQPATDESNDGQAWVVEDDPAEEDRP